jgi:hypothetical protein
MKYIISPTIRYRSEPFGGIAESWTTGLVIFNQEEFQKFLSFETPSTKTEEDFSNDSFLKELLDSELIVEE